MSRDLAANTSRPNSSRSALGEISLSSSFRENGSVISPDVMTVNNFRTSSWSLNIRLGSASLCVTTRSESCKAYMSLIIILFISHIRVQQQGIAVVIAARSWQARNQRAWALGLWLMPMMPTVVLLSRLMDCSMAMSVQTCANGCVDRLMERFPHINSTWTAGWL